MSDLNRFSTRLVFLLVTVASLHVSTVAAAQGAKQALQLAPGWSHYKSLYSDVHASLQTTTVTIGGLLRASKAGGWSTLAILPPNMRPKKRLIFNVNNQANTARVDVLPNGNIVWVAGGHGHGFLSLDGISFDISAGKPLRLASGWSAYGKGYRPPSAKRVGSTARLSGLLRASKAGGWSTLAILPPNMRPKKRLIFNVNNQANTARVDVLPNGNIVWVAGGHGHGFLSLDGITFDISAGKPLRLASGWSAYGEAYRPPSAKKTGSTARLSGLLRASRGDGWTKLANLPSNMRPTKRMIFNVNNQANTARVDVLPNGDIVWVAGGHGHGFLSLDGISFVQGKVSSAAPARPTARPTPQRVAALPWKKMPGLAVDISVGANGAVWLAGADGAAYRWNGRAWIKVGGRAISRIAADPKKGIWVIANGTQIWRYDGKTWKRLPGLATDIGVGANGTVWIAGTSTAPYRWNGKGWTRIGGGDIVRVAVDARGNAWVINKTNVIFQYVNNRFKQMPGRGTDIGIGANDVVWIVGTDNAPYRWDRKTWRKHAGGISGVSVGPKGYPWAVNAGKQIYADSRSRSVKSPPKPPTSVSGAAPSAAQADSILKRYPKFKNVKVSWKRNGSTLTGTARIGNATAKAVAFKPTGNRPAIAALIVPKMTIAQLLPPLGRNPLGSYSVNNVVIFTVPAARINIRHKISALPAVIANALKANDDAFGEAGATIDLAPGMTYFGKLDNPKGLVKTAFDRMKIRNVGIAGSIAFTEYARPVNTVTLTARLKKDPLTDVLGPIRVIAVDKSAEPSLFVTATGATDFEVGYSSTFKIFDQVLDGTLAFSKSGVGAAAETAVSVELSKQGAWRNPHLSGARLKNVTLNDAVITLSRTLGAAASDTSLSIVTESTRIHSTTYKPAAFTFTLEGASALPKATFVDLATRQVSLKEMAELMEVSLQLTPQGQLAQRSPFPPGKVFATLGLDKLPSNLIAFRNPKIYLATPGAIEPDPPPAPPLPSIAGAGVHVRGNVVAFGKQLARTATRIDFNGLHIDTKIAVLPFGGFQLRDARFKLDAAPKKRPIASFSGRTQIGPVPIASTTIDIGRTNFGFNIKSACIGLVKIEASGRTSGFRFSIPKPAVKTCGGDAAAAVFSAAGAVGRAAFSAGMAAAHSASDVAKKMDPTAGGREAYDAAMKGYRKAKEAWDKLSELWQGKRRKPTRPSAPPRLTCKFPQVIWEGQCQFNLAANFRDGASASQSSSYSSNDKAGRLIDGNLKDITSTKSEVNPWMKFSLGKNPVWVDRLVIKNRGDRFSNQLNGAIVAISAKYSGKDLMTKQDPEIYRIRLTNPGRATTIRPGKLGEGKRAKNVMIYHLPTAKKPKAVMALSEVFVFGNACRCPNYWRRVPGHGRDIAVGAGKVWLIGLDDMLYHSKVSFRNMPQTKSPWNKLPSGHGLRVAVDRKGIPWIVGMNNEIFRYKNNGWSSMGGHGIDIAGGGGKIWLIGMNDKLQITSDAPSGSASWSELPQGAGKQITIDRKGNPLVIGMDDAVYRYRNKGWSAVGGQGKTYGKDIAAGGGKTFVVDRNGTALRQEGNSWTRLSGRFTRIAVDATGRPWGISATGEVWTWHDYK